MASQTIDAFYMLISLTLRPLMPAAIAVRQPIYVSQNASLRAIAYSERLRS
jgi:hypothetical protein